MKFDDFLLDRWIQERSGPYIRHDFGGSTGPQWSLREVLALDGTSATERLLDLPLTYSRTGGADALRAAIGEMAKVPAEHVIVLTGAAECLTHVFLQATEPGTNVVLPDPCYPAQRALPRAFGVEIRSYRLRRENRFRADLDEITRLVDDRTRVLLVNVPHNPTGAVLGDDELSFLHDFSVERGVQFVCDEVHRPVFHGPETASAARLPHATTIGDFSKGFALPGLRLGWIIEPDAGRRAAYGNAREYVSISNSPVTEFLAEIAVRHRSTILQRTVGTAQANLEILDRMFTRSEDVVGWIRPAGGMVGFPWLKSGADARPFCIDALARGLLLIPGDCLGVPDHFRVGFGSQENGFERSVEMLKAFIRLRSTRAG